MLALTFDRFGGPDVLAYQEVPDPQPEAGRAILRLQAIGLNFADIYRRKGNYHLSGEPPYIAGYEGAGVIESLGGATSSFKVGDRVAFADSPYANAEKISVPYDKLIPLPEDISFETAAALLLQGLTAQYLVRDSHALKAGEQVLVHAAAGGVGLLLVQMAKLLGAQVMGLTSSERKAQAAREAGADATELYAGDWIAAAQAFGQGGVDVVFDSVGSTLMQSFEAARMGGHVVFYGFAGGDPPLIDPRMLMDTSKSITGGDLWNVLTSHQARVERAQELFGWVRKGQLKVNLAARFPLAEGAAAHALLESRQSSGKVILIP
jgi:NADPH:quinone reductase